MPATHLCNSRNPITAIFDITKSDELPHHMGQVMLTEALLSDTIGGRRYWEPARKRLHSAVAQPAEPTTTHCPGILVIAQLAAS